MVSQGLEPEDEEFISKAQNISEMGQYITPTIVAERLAADIIELSANDPEVIYDFGCGPGALTKQILNRFPECRAKGYDIDEGALAAYEKRFEGRCETEQRDLLLYPIEGGVDHAISNPPYLLSRRIGRARTKQIRERGYFKTAVGKLNTFGLFIEMAGKALNPGGGAAFIVPRSAPPNHALDALREHIENRR